MYEHHILPWNFTCHECTRMLLQICMYVCSYITNLWGEVCKFINSWHGKFWLFSASGSIKFSLPYWIHYSTCTFFLIQIWKNLDLTVDTLLQTCWEHWETRFVLSSTVLPLTVGRAVIWLQPQVVQRIQHRMYCGPMSNFSPVVWVAKWQQVNGLWYWYA